MPWCKEQGWQHAPSPSPCSSPACSSQTEPAATTGYVKLQGVEGKHVGTLLPTFPPFFKAEQSRLCLALGQWAGEQAARSPPPPKKKSNWTRSSFRLDSAGWQGGGWRAGRQQVSPSSVKSEATRFSRLAILPTLSGCALQSFPLLTARQPLITLP